MPPSDRPESWNAAAPRRLRVLVVSTVFPSAAQPLHGLFVRRRLRALPPAVEARVLAPAPWFPFTAGLRPGYRPPVPPREEQDGVRVEHPRFLSVPGVLKCLDGLFLFLALWLAVRRGRRDFRCDLIDAHFAYPEGFAAVLLGRLLNVPVVLTERGTLPLVARYRLRRPLAAYALRHADRVIAVSESLRREAARLGRPAREVRVIANGVDADCFRPLDRRQARRELGLPEDARYLVTVGTLVLRKGVHLVLEAVAALRREGMDLRYLVVGGPGAEGFDGGELRQRAERLGLAPYVVFAGPRSPEELARWYSAADAFVLASDREGSSNALLEAIACGTPVVATAAGDAAEVAASGAGVLAARRDAVALQGAIAEVLARPWDRGALREWAAARSWEVVGEEVAAEFRAALAGCGARAGLRVLYHHRTRAGDAQGIHIAEMQRALRERGHEVLEVALVPSSPAASAEGNAARAGGAAGRLAGLARRGPRWWREVVELAYNPWAYRRLVRAARAFGADAIYERYAAFTVAGAWAARRCGIPLLLEVNAPLARERQAEEAEGGLSFPRLAGAIERYVCRRASRTLVVSDALRRLLLADGAPRDRLLVVPNGVRRELEQGGGDGAAARRRLGVPAGATVVGVVGWFRRWHGLDRLLEAAASPEWRAAGLHLVLAGEGPALAELAPAARRLGDRVTLAGAVPREELADLLAAFDVAVQPAVTPYACPMKLVEYMAAGRAIVAPDCDNVRELLDDRETALLCGDGPRPAAGELLAAILDLAADPELRRRLGESARRRVAERGYYWDENARRVEELLASGPALRPAPRLAEEARPC